MLDAGATAVDKGVDWEGVLTGAVVEVEVDAEVAATGDLKGVAKGRFTPNKEVLEGFKGCRWFGARGVMLAAVEFSRPTLLVPVIGFCTWPAALPGKVDFKRTGRILDPNH